MTSYMCSVILNGFLCIIGMFTAQLISLEAAACTLFILLWTQKIFLNSYVHQHPPTGANFFTGKGLEIQAGKMKEWVYFITLLKFCFYETPATFQGLIIVLNLQLINVNPLWKSSVH